MNVKHGVLVCAAAVMLAFVFLPVSRRAVQTDPLAAPRSPAAGVAVLPSGLLPAVDTRVAPSPGSFLVPRQLTQPVGRAGSSAVSSVDVVASPSSVASSTDPFYASLVERAGARYGIHPRLLHALIQVESAYRPDAVSPAGALGLMQLMPATARRYGVSDPFDPAANIDAGTRHLRMLLESFGPGYEIRALAAYNAGEAVVRRHRGIPPYPETRRFVRRVLAILAWQTRSAQLR